jgi:Tol biopolymer transport system component/predicted Ser/Thr protein kinase
MAIVQSGSHLGPYEIVAQIGAGGMGEVWKARDTRLDRIVAIKVSKEQFSDRFEREARAVAALNHPHICTLYDVGPDYLVMEYVEGRPLEGPLPLEQVVTYGIQICDALTAAHRKGIVHRDLKPGNILVTKSGVKLLDFGLAKTSSADSGQDAQTSPVTQDGMVMGTLQYMSPEQLEGKKADARSDIYSLGLVLYEMVTGKRAFPHTDLESLQPPALERVVKTCLAKDPDARWQTAREVRLGLEWSAGSGTAIVSAGAHPRSRWRERAVWIGVAVVLVALSIVATRRWQTSPAVEVTRFAIYPPENDNWSGAVYATIPVPQFALSPNGRAIVFVASAPDSGPMLWLRPLEDVTARPLTGTENAQDPFWSPDSRWVGFFADGNLKKIRIGGGPLQVVAEGVVDSRGGSWGSDGTILFAPSAGPISRVAADGTVTPVTRLDEARKEGSHRWPQFLPDGQHFLYSVLSGLAEQRGVYVGSLDGKTKKFLLKARSDSNAFYASPGHLLFVDGDTLLGQAFDAAHLQLTGQSFTVAERVGRSTAFNSAVSVSSAGTLAYAGLILRLGRLTWFDRAGKPSESVGPESDYTDFRLSPDERKLAASVVDPKFGAPDIWITELTRGGPLRLTLGPEVDASALWSPDGARILFRTVRSRGVIDFYQKSAAGGGDEEPIMLAEAARAAGTESSTLVPTDWSSDGRHVIFSVAPTSYGLWLLPLAGDRKPISFLRSPGAMHANFSRDGNLVAYTSNESGKHEVYVQTVPLSDRKWQVSIGGGYEPRWGRDVNELYYLSDDRKLMAVSVGAGPSFGAPKVLFQTQVPAGVSPFRTNYVPTQDGQRFLIKTQGSEPAPNPITVVLNWNAGFE